MAAGRCGGGAGEGGRRGDAKPKGGRVPGRGNSGAPTLRAYPSYGVISMLHLFSRRIREACGNASLLWWLSGVSDFGYLDGACRLWIERQRKRYDTVRRWMLFLCCETAFWDLPASQGWLIGWPCSLAHTEVLYMAVMHCTGGQELPPNLR